MRIGLIGGTGKLGEGLALRLSAKHDVIVGSRNYEKGRATAETYMKTLREKHAMAERSIVGCDNQSAAKDSDIIVLTIPHETVRETMASIRAAVDEDKTVVSAVVPVEKRGREFFYTPYKTTNGRIVSAGELTAQELPPSDRVVSAFHSLSSKKLADLGSTNEVSVLMCSDSPQRVRLVSNVVSDVKGWTAINVGPLSLSSQLETLAVVMLNIAAHANRREPMIRVV